MKVFSFLKSIESAYTIKIKYSQEEALICMSIIKK